MSSKESKKNTILKPTPAGDGVVPQAKEVEEMAKTNLNQELDNEHPAGKLMVKLTELVKYAREGSFSTTINTLALAMGIREFEEAVPISEFVSNIMLSYDAAPNDIIIGDLEEAVIEIEKSIADREGRLMLKISQRAMKTEEDGKAAMLKLEEAESKLRRAEDKLKKSASKDNHSSTKKEKKEKKSKKKKYDSDDDDDDASSESSKASSDDSSLASDQFTVVCKATSKAIERLAKVNFNLSPELEKHCAAYIDALEAGKAHEAKLEMKAIFESAAEGLSINGDAAGNKPLSEAFRQGHFGGGSEGRYTVSKGSSKQSQLSQTVNQVIANHKDDVDKSFEFTNVPIETDEMNDYVEEAESKLFNHKVQLPPGIKRTRKSSVEVGKGVSLGVTERAIAQERIYKTMVNAIKKSKNKFENQDAYITIVSRLDEMIKLEKESPIPVYEIPNEVTLCMRIAKKYLHLGSYLLSEIQQLNKDQAAHNYTVNALSLFTKEAQMGSGETMSAFVNRMNETCDHCNSQKSPIPLNLFGWPTQHDGPGAPHALYTDAYKAYFCISNFNHVVVKRDSAARSFISEDLLKRAAHAECTMDEVNDLVTRMNKLDIGAVSKHNKKGAVNQSQSFSTITDNSSKKRNNNKKDGSAKIVGKLSNDEKVKLYQQKVQSLGGHGFPNLEKQIEVLNHHVQKLAGSKLIKKSSSTISVAEEFGSIERVKMPTERMGEDMWCLFQVIRDVYGCTGSGRLSGLGMSYMQQLDPKYLSKIESWRMKHGIKQKTREHVQFANSSINKKSEKKSEKKPKSDKTAKQKKSKKAASNSDVSDSSSSDDESIAFSGGGSGSESNYSRSSKRSAKSSASSVDSSSESD